MASQDDIVRFLDQQNPGILTYENIAFVLIVVAMTVIPLHTQKTTSLAERRYWLYFETNADAGRYRVKINLQKLREIFNKDLNDRANELDKYIKSSRKSKKGDGLQKFTTDDWKKDDGANYGTIKNNVLNDDNIIYSYLDTNIWWLLEYYLFMFGLLASLYILRIIVNYTGNIVYQSEDITSIVVISDMLSIVGSVFMIYYLDMDYTDPSKLKAGFNWFYAYISIVAILVIGQVRHLETVSKMIFPLHKINMRQPLTLGYAIGPIIIIVGVIMAIFWLTYYIESEEFTLNPSIISDEEEKSIQDLIDEQTRSN